MVHPFWVTVAIYALFAALGVSSTLFGLVLTDVTGALGISLAYAGLVTTLFAVGRTIGSFVSGPWTDRWGDRLVTWLGLGAMLVGLAALGSAPAALIFFTGSLVMGLGFGALDVALNTSISTLYPERRASMLSLLHGFYGVGSFVGPLLLGVVIGWQSSWRAAPWAAALVFLLAAVAYGALAKSPRLAGQQTPETSESMHRPMRKKVPLGL